MRPVWTRFGPMWNIFADRCGTDFGRCGQELRSMWTRIEPMWTIFVHDVDKMWGRCGKIWFAVWGNNFGRCGEHRGEILILCADNLCGQGLDQGETTSGEPMCKGLGG